MRLFGLLQKVTDVLREIKAIEEAPIKAVMEDLLLLGYLLDFLFETLEFFEVLAFLVLGLDWHFLRISETLDFRVEGLLGFVGRLAYSVKFFGVYVV